MIIDEETDKTTIRPSTVTKALITAKGFVISAEEKNSLQL